MLFLAFFIGKNRYFWKKGKKWAKFSNFSAEWFSNFDLVYIIQFLSSRDLKNICWRPNVILLEKIKVLFTIGLFKPKMTFLIYIWKYI